MLLLQGFSLTTAIFVAVKRLEETFELVPDVNPPIGAQRHAGVSPWQEGKKKKKERYKTEGNCERRREHLDKSLSL